MCQYSFRTAPDQSEFTSELISLRPHSTWHQLLLYITHTGMRLRHRNLRKMLRWRIEGLVFVVGVIRLVFPHKQLYCDSRLWTLCSSKIHTNPTCGLSEVFNSLVLNHTISAQPGDLGFWSLLLFDCGEANPWKRSQRLNQIRKCDHA